MTTVAGGQIAPAAAGLPVVPGTPTLPFDVERVRADFPILRRTVRGKPLVYLDNAATTQKPQAVIDALTAYYTGINANVHRGVHELSERATEAYEAARARVQAFFHAAHAHEVVFTRNATESINLVARSFARPRLQPGDEVLITAMEHHSNIVPWQLACEATGATIRVAPIDDRGALIVDEFARLLGPRTVIAAVSHMSNALGTVNPAAEIVALAHRHGVPVLLDGSQAAYHMAVDVQALDCDFYVATGHKLYGPTGIGVLVGKTEHLEAMPPFLGGGDMIRSVSFERSTWNDLPYKFEAGTPNIAGAVGLHAALDYLGAAGFEAVAAHERDLLAYGTAALQDVPGLRIIGTAPSKASILSFVIDGMHPHDIGTIVDREGVAVRTGHHCAQPVMERFGIPATARASLAMYNTRADLDALVGALHRVREVLG
ncbi:MAG TPA: cysteine desulfurase [Vicinamibacterales bacterium]|nr:cysteine desulfurase [Vicinamibacterales bacterium]